MKKINYFLFFILLAANIVAQNKPQMNVLTKDGKTVPFDLENITDITFTTTFTCGTSTIDYGGKTYNTVQIGTQCWLKENLDIGTIINTGQSQSDNGIIEKYCYNNDPANCTTYGGLYQWNETMLYDTTSGNNGICPTGWHIPKYSEVQALSNAVGGNTNALKEIGQGSGAGAGTNTSGFSGLLAGIWDGNVSRNINDVLHMWTSDQNSTKSSAYKMDLYWNDSIFQFNYAIKDIGISVRCLKD